MNFQDIIREVYDGSQKALKTTASLSASTVYVGNPTLYAVVNTGSASDPKTFIGLTTSVIGSAPTLFAVVNTSAPGVGNNIVTVANVPLPTQQTGNVTLDPGSKTQIVGNVTLSDSKGFIGLTTIKGGVFIADPSQTNIADVGATGDDSSASAKALYVAGYGHAFNGATWDRIKSVGAAASQASISMGLLGAGVMGYDGSLYQRPYVSSDGIQKSLVTVSNVARTITGNLTLSDPKGFIGLVTVVGSLSAAAGNITLDDGSLTGIVGNVTLSDAKTYIGLVTATAIASGDIASGSADSGNPVKVAGKYNSTKPSFSDGQRGDLQLTSRGAIAVSLFRPDQATGNIYRADNTDGVATSANIDNMGVINRNTVFNGTAWDRMPGNVSGVFINNAGTNKTLVILPVGLGNNSLATVAVPTNAQRIKVTNLLLSSNVTTEIAIKSGVTYLTGNASLGVTLFPGGGFELPGGPDTPSWIGLPSGALVVEKRDPGGTTSKIGGHAIYFDEI